MRQVKKRKTQYRWVCNWTNGLGCFNADFESCNAHGRFVDNLQTAIKGGQKHQHYGRFEAVYIESRSPTGRIKSLGECSKVGA